MNTEYLKDANKSIPDVRPRKRTNCQCICELANEMLELDIKIEHLSTAIKADSYYVDKSAKALWPVQLEAMVAYKKALQERIKNLIDLDTESYDEPSDQLSLNL